MSASASSKILMVIHQIGSGADGGIQSVSELIHFTPELEKYIVTNIKSKTSESWRAHGTVAYWPMFESSYVSTHSRFWYRFHQIRLRCANNYRVWALLRLHNIKVVHANEHRAFWNSVFGAKLAGAKIIFNVRDTMRQGKQVRKLIWQTALAMCDCFLVLSCEMIASWRADLSPTSRKSKNRQKFRFIYSIIDRTRHYPVDCDLRTELRRKLGIHSSRPAIVYVGRFDDKKNQREYIRDLVPALKALSPDAITYFVGDFALSDTYAASCKADVETLGLSDVICFAGYSSQVPDWYRAADLIVLASRREGLARCMIEGLACGTPIVSFSVCSAREILERHECGVVIEQGNYHALAHALAGLLQDPHHLKELRARAMRCADEVFRDEINAGLYVRLVEEFNT